MAHFIVEKRSMEYLPYDVDFTGLLSDSDTILDTTKTTAVVKDSAGVDQTALIIKSKSFSGKVVTLNLKDGVDGEDYNIWVTGVGDVSFATNNPVRVIELRVRDYIVGNV